MTVQSKINEIPYIYNTAITKYDFPFKVLDADTVFVSIIEDDIETDLEPIDDYDVDLYSDGKGFVTILKEDITNGVIIWIKRLTNLEQTESLDSPTYDRAKLEAIFDNIAFTTIDLENAINEDSIVRSDELSTFNHTISNIIPGGLLVSDGTQLFIKKEVGFIGEGYVSNVSANNSGLIHKVGDVYKGVDFASFGSTRNLIVTKTVTDFSFALSANPWLDGLEGFIPPKGTTAQRIAAPKSIRFNTTLSQFEMSVDGVVFEAPVHTPEPLTVFSGYLKIPSGTTSQRISAGIANGYLRVNTQLSALEVSSNSQYLSNVSKEVNPVTVYVPTSFDSTNATHSFSMTSSLSGVILYPAMSVITIGFDIKLSALDPYYMEIILYNGGTSAIYARTCFALPTKHPTVLNTIIQTTKDLIYYGNEITSPVISVSYYNSDFTSASGKVTTLGVSARSQAFTSVS